MRWCQDLLVPADNLEAMASQHATRSIGHATFLVKSNSHLPGAGAVLGARSGRFKTGHGTPGRLEFDAATTRTTLDKGFSVRPLLAGTLYGRERLAHFPLAGRAGYGRALLSQSVLAAFHTKRH